MLFVDNNKFYCLPVLKSESRYDRLRYSQSAINIHDRCVVSELAVTLSWLDIMFT